MECSKISKALERNQLDFVNGNKTFCQTSKHYEWFKSVENLTLATCIENHKVLFIAHYLIIIITKSFVSGVENVHCKLYLQSLKNGYLAW